MCRLTHRSRGLAPDLKREVQAVRMIPLSYIQEQTINTVVYYPHTSPPVEWMKIAALCWDKVYRSLPCSATWEGFLNLRRIYVRAERGSEKACLAAAKGPRTIK